MAEPTADRGGPVWFGMGVRVRGVRGGLKRRPQPPPTSSSSSSASTSSPYSAQWPQQHTRHLHACAKLSPPPPPSDHTSITQQDSLCREREIGREREIERERKQGRRAKQREAEGAYDTKEGGLGRVRERETEREGERERGSERGREGGRASSASVRPAGC